MSLKEHYHGLNMRQMSLAAPLLVKATSFEGRVPCRALVKGWVGLGREGGQGGPSSMFPLAWAQAQSSYPTQLRVSYLPTKQ